MSTYVVAGILGPDGHRATGPAKLTVDSGILSVQTQASAHGSTLVAMPPLVNSHDHGRGRGLTAAGIADGPLEVWIDRLSADRRDQTDLVGRAAEQMLCQGIGATVLCVNPGTPDLEYEIDTACAAARSAGIRTAVVVPFADAAGRMRGRDETGYTATELSARLQMFQRLAQRAPDLELQLGPVGPQWVSEHTLLELNDFALDHGVRLHTHLLESPSQRAWADEVYPEGLVAWLDRRGILGPHVTFAHGTQLRSDELELLAERGCGLAVNASSNLRLCSGFAPVAAARAARLPTAMGLDGLSLNEDSDPWTELRLLRGIAQAQSNETVSAADILALGFHAGAMGAQRPEPMADGSRADLLVVDIGEWAQLLDRDDWYLPEIVLAARVAVHALWVSGVAVGADRGHDTGRPVLSIGGMA
ncbi:amidohydrolase family protein [Mycobacterium sp. ITM-2016-00317]|uniref:amidohydrolase family protein n=1 Tax=Mycobacterium sp. ITM-2016-00317 TaxID=2099694 RepID=UPI00287F4127|nr:amidohydrolase family protein [Mycobacterium sp. ITM-2016-00317]WNG89099.1 amidohydrolase family protein [Mycobacterium sp. ITM-2016-00317]